MINPETTKEFQKTVEDEFGVILSDSDALKILLDLVGYFDLLAKIDSRKNVQVS